MKIDIVTTEINKKTADWLRDIADEIEERGIAWIDQKSCLEVNEIDVTKPGDSLIRKKAGLNRKLWLNWTYRK